LAAACLRFDPVAGLGQSDGLSPIGEELMLRELTNAEMSALSGGQANTITINESATATPTSGAITVIIPNFSTPARFTDSFHVAPGLATTSVSVSQPGS
jgi:hypothetical protein